MGLEFQTDGGYGAQAFGLIVLSTDETMEPEIAPLFAEAGAPVYHSRIPSAADVTPETLAKMETDLPGAARLLPRAARFAAIGYGCTSGATVIGADRVAELVQAECGPVPVTNPLSATIDACKALGVSRLGMLTPYAPRVSEALRAALETAGISITAFASFEEQEERVVARIAESSTLRALAGLAASPCEAIFASCTNLRSFSILAEAERLTGKPVFSSNSALAWHMARLAGRQLAGPGQLFAV